MDLLAISLVVGILALVFCFSLLKWIFRHPLLFILILVVTYLATRL